MIVCDLFFILSFSLPCFLFPKRCYLRLLSALEATLFVFSVIFFRTYKCISGSSFFFLIFSLYLWIGPKLKTKRLFSYRSNICTKAIACLQYSRTGHYVYFKGSDFTRRGRQSPLAGQSQLNPCQHKQRGGEYERLANFWISRLQCQYLVES